MSFGTQSREREQYGDFFLVGGGERAPGLFFVIDQGGHSLATCKSRQEALDTIADVQRKITIQERMDARL